MRSKWQIENVSFHPTDHVFQTTVDAAWILPILRWACFSRVLAAFFCLPLCVHGDDLLRDGTSVSSLGGPDALKGVIVQALEHFDDLKPPTNFLSYWIIDNGMIRQASVDAKGYHATFAPEKLDAIRDQWTSSGSTIEIQYRDGRAPLVLNNSSVSWRPPDGYVFSLFAGSSTPELYRGRPELPLFGRGSIPLRTIETVEFKEDGALVVSLEEGAIFSAQVLNKSVRGADGKYADLVPCVAGFTYEPNGAFTEESVKLGRPYNPEEPQSSRPYFREHTVRFTEIRKVKVLNALPRNVAK